MQRKHIFLAGANTAEGFVSKFNEILSKERKGYTYILKGGPGTGKSTLMKKISKYFVERGYNVEEFFCSSDSKSLDAVRIVEKNICVTDGTAPHEQDASLPKVSGEIIDLGKSVNPHIIKHKSKINKLLKQKQTCFKNAYAYLRAAGDIASAFCGDSCFQLPKIVKKRTFYLDYFSGSGICSYQNKNKFKIYSLNKNNESIFNSYLNESADIIEIKDVVTGNTKSVIFKDKNILFKTQTLRLSKENSKLIQKLFVLAGESLESAKNYHKQVEKIYLDYINFNELNKITEKIIKDIEKK